MAVSPVILAGVHVRMEPLEKAHLAGLAALGATYTTRSISASVSRAPTKVGSRTASKWSIDSGIESQSATSQFHSYRGTLAPNNGGAEGLSHGPRSQDRESSVASSSNPVNRRRSERVVLQMKVLVMTEDPGRKHRQEEAQTQVVNAHGGLLKMKTGVRVGQAILILNPKKGVEQSCRVVRVDDTGEELLSVAFEFDQPNPKFWPIVFPPVDWEAPPA